MAHRKGINGPLEALEARLGPMPRQCDGLPVREYLSAVLPGLAGLQLQRLPDLKPTAWAGQY
jgi:hypothetical protein